MIILIGFPKSGTSSFQTLFTELGYESYHQHYKNTRIAKLIKNNIDNNKPMLDGFPNHIVITQLDFCFSDFCFFPQVEYYKKLYEENREAIFILNKRDTTDTLISIKNWGDLFQRILKYGADMFSNIVGENDDSKMINLLNAHYNNIEKYFESLPDAKYISYDIYKDKIEKLSIYIDIKNMTDFPYSNMNNNKKKIETLIQPLKCFREGCLFKKHTVKTNNGGTHCCLMCKNKAMHGPLCEKAIH